MVALTAVNDQGVRKTAWLTRVIVAVALAALATVVVGALLGGEASADNLGAIVSSGGWSGSPSAPRSGWCGAGSPSGAGERLNRRQFLASAGGVVGAAASASVLSGHVWPLLNKEDLIPGRAPALDLQPEAWPTGEDRLRFAAVGDNGSGGRQAMAVAERMAQTYRAEPFELVALLGDICYYRNFADRYDEVFRRPMGPLLDAGVGFELAIGNHDAALRHSDEGIAEIEAELRLLGTPSTYYTTSHGPADFFYLDSSVPGVFGPESSRQWEWLDDMLASSTSQWKIVSLHHPLYSSGRHGSTVGARERLEPILARRRVDLVLAGHDHNYERIHPQQGVTYVVSGGGCKTTAVGRSRFTAVAASVLQFLLVDIVGDRLTASCVAVDGAVIDRFELRAREGRGARSSTRSRRPSTRRSISWSSWLRRWR